METMKVTRQSFMACKYKGKYFLAEFENIEQDAPIILGLPTCTQMVKRIDSIQHNPEDMLETFKDMFYSLGCIQGAQHCIRINQSQAPVIHALCRVPIVIRHRVKDKLEHIE